VRTQGRLDEVTELRGRVAIAVHRAGFMKSLGVHSAGELVAYAIRHRHVHVH
jgi:hypothetical protein